MLTIAGFDPSSGAGVTADLMVFAAHGLFGTSCITGLTVQSTVGVRSTTAVSAEAVKATLDFLASDLPPAGIKIGMLSTAENVDAVAEFLRGFRDDQRRVPVVLDPVLRSSSGRELLDVEGVVAMRKNLLPLVDWVTPNLEELAVLTEGEGGGREDMPAAALALQEFGWGVNVLVTGGHLNPPDDLVAPAEGEMFWVPGEQVVSRSTHGTGCAFSSALLSRLVWGDAARDAAVAAKQYVADGIR